MLSKDELKRIKGGNYIYYLNGYKMDCSQPLVERPTCKPNNIPSFCLVSPDMCPDEDYLS